MSIRANEHTTDVKLTFSQPINIYGDIDVLIAMNMHKVHKSKLSKLLPDPDLAKLITNQ